MIIRSYQCATTCMAKIHLILALWDDCKLKNKEVLR